MKRLSTSLNNLSRMQIKVKNNTNKIERKEKIRHLKYAIKMTKKYLKLIDTSDESIISRNEYKIEIYQRELDRLQSEAKRMNNENIITTCKICGKDIEVLPKYAKYLEEYSGHSIHQIETICESCAALDRVKQEKQELEEKINRLSDYMYKDQENSHFEKLSKVQQTLLKTQMHTMILYHGILEQRIQNW